MQQAANFYSTNLPPINSAYYLLPAVTYKIAKGIFDAELDIILVKNLNIINKVDIR